MLSCIVISKMLLSYCSKSSKRKKNFFFWNDIRLYSASGGATAQLLINKTIVFFLTACSFALIKFACRPDTEQYVVVGTVKELLMTNGTHAGGSIIVYKLSPTGDQLELVHRTAVEEKPGALASFQGRLVAGVGKHLRIYDLGKKKLLRKCENKVRTTGWESNWWLNCNAGFILIAFFLLCGRY